jgi:hypothetical protein
VKLVLITGRNTRDADAVLTFADGNVSIVDRRDGTRQVLLPYGEILGSTYVHARSPRWNQMLFSPPANLDVGGVFRTSKHWLVLQAVDAYVVLKLDDRTVSRALQTLETRTAREVSRP